MFFFFLVRSGTSGTTLVHAIDIVLCEDRNKKLNNRINVGFTYSIKGKAVPTHAMKAYKAMEVQTTLP
jgi:hypothetical protein